MWKLLCGMALLSMLVLAACTSTKGPIVKPLYKLESQAGSAALAVSADSRKLVTGGWSGSLAIWDLTDGTALGRLKGHEAEIIGIEFLPDGTVLSGGREGRIKQWALDGRLLRTHDLGSSLSAMTLHQSSDRLATGNLLGEILIWDFKTDEPVHRWQGHDSRIRAVAYSDEAQLLASSDTDRKVKLWNAAGGELLWESHVPSDSRTLLFSADGHWLYGGGWFDLFKWNVATGELQVIDTDHWGIINDLALLKSSGALASVSRQTDSSVLLIDPINGRTLRNFGIHKMCGGHITVSPDEIYLISNSDDYSISVWQLGSPLQ